MIVNRNSLLDVAPIQGMAPHKIRALDSPVSCGLSEAGYDITIAQTITLHPFRRFRLASAVEPFDMPDDLVGVVHDKSTWARKGLSVFNTVIEPGWSGYLTLELVYHGFKPLRIKRGYGIAQVIFHAVTDRATYTGKYSNQPNRPVAAKYG